MKNRLKDEVLNRQLYYIVPKFIFQSGNMQYQELLTHSLDLLEQMQQSKNKVNKLEDQPT